MAADNNPYFIIPMTTGDTVVQALEFAILMAEKSYPHLTDNMKRAMSMFRENALGFVGSQNIPRSAKPAYKEEQK